MPNRLAQETSPYLRQHQDNPVDWYAWGDEALARAAHEDRPIMLSIGYSACHWCHVMEHESFASPEIAAQMNEAFVCIKVDREERPDLDHVYQLVVQLMGRSGGWPLTVFLTPEKRPFFAGTYFPPVPRHGMPSFPQVLAAIREAYEQRRGEVESSATDITTAITRALAPETARATVAPGFLAGVAATILRRADTRHGGFGGAPKFPSTMSLDILLRAHSTGGRGQLAQNLPPNALAHVRLTLDQMRAGGIYDQLGGGFHRYSTDDHWLVPHFEKMLYDNALLLRLYVDGWRVTGEPRYRKTAEEIVAYVAREMVSPQGAFYSTQDADSEGEEGRFFAWTPAQLVEVLGDADAAIAAEYWGVGEGGNFEHGTTVLSVAEPVAPPGLDAIREKLFVAREKRVKPFRDEKVIAAWNGLMIGALAEAGAAFAMPSWLELARRGLRFARQRLFAGGVLRRIAMGEGAARIDAFLDDHAELACAALDVYECGGDADALVFAQALVDAAIARFWDDAAGTFWFAREAADLVVRVRDTQDNAVPAGTSSIARALLRLHALTGEASYLEKAERTVLGIADDALRVPHGFGHLLGALDLYVHGATEVTIVGVPGDAATESLRQAALAAYVPLRALSLVAAGDRADRLQKGAVATAYVCRGRTCSAPVTAPGDLRDLLVVAPVAG